MVEQVGNSGIVFQKSPVAAKTPTRERTMQKYPQQIKKQLDELSRQAHENELSNELARLAKKFDAWREGKISAGKLGSIVHDHDTGPLRDQFRFYNKAPVHMRVGYAVAQGILAEKEIPAKVWPYIKKAVEFYKSEMIETP